MSIPRLPLPPRLTCYLVTTLPVRARSDRISSSALVGYAAIDGDDNWVLPLAEYLACDPTNANSGASSIDLFGLNN